MENKIIEFDTGKAKGVLVEVPKTANKRMYIKKAYANFYNLYYREKGLNRIYEVILPPGDWQLVGTSDTMSEDDWKGIGICAPLDSKRYAVLILKEK